MDNTTLAQKSAALFARFCEKLNNIDAVNAMTVTAVMGTMTVLYGMGLEATGQAELLQSGGQAALDAYSNTIQMLGEIQRDKHPSGGIAREIADYMDTALNGDHESFGGNAQGTGLAMIASSPALALAMFTLSNGLDAIKDFFMDKLKASAAEEKPEPEMDVGSVQNPTMVTC